MVVEPACSRAGLTIRRTCSERQFRSTHKLAQATSASIDAAMMYNSKMPNTRPATSARTANVAVAKPARVGMASGCSGGNHLQDLIDQFGCCHTTQLGVVIQHESVRQHVWC